MNDTLGMGGHQSPKAGTDTWLTPPHILQALGPFDLDPCAAPEPRPWPTASVHWTASDKPMKRAWALEGVPARVWLHAPHNGPLSSGPWLRKMAQHNVGIALTLAWTETDVFHEHVWPVASGILFLRGRLFFCRPNGRPAGNNAGAPSCLVAYGKADAEILRECGLAGKFVELNRKKGA